MAQKKCIMCGRLFDPEQVAQQNKNPYLDEDDDLPKKEPSFCQLCEARIRREADDSQKVPKPM